MRTVNPTLAHEVSTGSTASVAASDDSAPDGLDESLARSGAGAARPPSAEDDPGTEAANAEDEDAKPGGNLDSPDTGAGTATAQELRISVRLKPHGDDFLALLSVSTPATDVVARTATVPTVQAALEEAATIVEEARERWAQAPRYPKHQATRAGKPATAKPQGRSPKPAVAPTLQRLTGAPDGGGLAAPTVTNAAEVSTIPSTAAAALKVATGGLGTDEAPETSRSEGTLAVVRAGNAAAGEAPRRTDPAQPALF